MSFPQDLACEAILDSIADGVFTVDLDWNVTSFNAAAERITGIPRAEALGSKCWEVFRSSLCDGECALGRCIARGGSIQNKSIFFIRADGERVPVSISAARLTDENGRALGGVETFRDLSDIHFMRRKMEKTYTFEDIVGKSGSLKKIFSVLPQISGSRSTVLLLGESGTGKELFARAVHSLSPRKNGPFVAVNCGALPDTLLESELFGYKAGAFTDAKRDKPGRFETASGGTIFLDEIGDLPAKLQVKLLRVLQEKVFEPLGGVSPVKTDVRVIAATNRDLDGLVASGDFRQDLFYRLNVVTLRLPPLRERPEDIPLLVQHFVRLYNAEQGKSVEGLSEDAMHLVMRHDFPGNVRELENILEYAFIMCAQGFIQVEHLPETLRPARSGRGAASDGDGPVTMQQAKCLAARRALARNSGGRMAACRELGVSKDTLRRVLARCEDEEPSVQGEQ